MRKLFLLSVVMCLGIFSSYAQSETVVNIESKRGPYLTNRFFDNWFISIGGGAQVYIGEKDWYGPFDKRLAPSLDVSAGKWITPSVGVRLQYSGLQAKGWNYGEAAYTKGVYKNGFYNEKYNILNLHADFLWNASNAISGYKEDRFWDLIPYVGFGWARTWGNNTHKNEMAGTVGLLNNMRISNAFDINLEAKLMITNTRLNQVIRGNSFEGMVSLTAGITYNFPNREFKRASDIIVIDDNTEFINTISDLKGKLAKAHNARQSLEKQLAAERAKQPKVVEKHIPVVADIALFFNIGKAELSKKDKINLEYVADAIKKSDGKFVIFASSDKETGSASWNQKLSEMRAQAVYDVLTKEYGVKPDQLRIEAVGSTVQKFDGAQYNRVVVIEDVK